MFKQRLKRFVCLRECVGLFARRGAGLHGRLDTKLYKQLGKLWVAHQIIAVVVSQCKALLFHNLF